ncbi:hypothetical protein Ga0466249_005348 [Sporomusaceae bacterium BoRhaA]|nr:hypothetical protein [Pelorhabdus rhamnosifermentans]
MTVELSDKTKSICQENYKSNCGGCELRPACVSHINFGIEGLNKWAAKINNLAEVSNHD